MSNVPSATLKGNGGNNSIYISKVVFKDTRDEFPEVGNDKYLYVARLENAIYCWQNKYRMISGIGNSDGASIGINDDIISGQFAWSGKKIKTELVDTSERINLIIGDLSDLATEVKSNIVSAVNEIKRTTDNNIVAVEESTPNLGMYKTYLVKQGRKTVGHIDIPQDNMVISGSVVTNPTNQSAGKYLRLILSNQDSPVYINVDSLIDKYISQSNARQIQISIDESTNEISATIIKNSITSESLAYESVTLANLTNEVKDAFDAKNSAAQALIDSKQYTDKSVNNTANQILSLEASIANKANSTEVVGLQEQINNIVLASTEGGNADAEVMQARVNKNGANFTTLKDRLDADQTEINLLNETMSRQNSVNLLAIGTSVDTHNGITYTPIGDGTYHVQGTASAASFLRLLHSPSEVPSDIVRGKKYKLNFSTTDSYITLRVYYYYNDGTEEYVSYGNSNGDTFITIPENLKGITIRSNIASGRTVDGTFSATLFNAISNKELEERLDGIYDTPSCNLVNLNNIKSSSYATATHNTDGSITLETKEAGEHCFVKIPLPSEVFQPQKSYYLYIKVDSCESNTAPYISMRFVGTYEGESKLSNGINTFGKPGEYCSIIYTHGYERELRLYITGSTAATAKVVVSRIMVAESDFALPYVPYGNTITDINAIARLNGLKNTEKSWAISNVLAHAHQLAHIRFTPLNVLPNQFGDFAAGKEVMGLPYSSARAVDKLIGTHVSIYTFMSAIANPRSVVYTRRLTTKNAETYYGIVCSAFVNYCFGLSDVNLTTADYRNWEKIHEKPYTSLKIGDVMINGGHIILITDLIRDSYGRITNVSYTEAGSPVIRVVEGVYWHKFVEDRMSEGYKAYSYEDIENTVYAPSPFVKGYPDDVVDEVVFPDIMSEYGDKCCLLAGESTTINVINEKDYTTITVSLNGEIVDTRTDIADFEITNLQGGEYEITLSNGSVLSTTKFFVVDVTCSYDSENHVVSFASSNAVPCACYVYDDNPTNKYVELTAENIETGTVDVSEFVSETHQYVKVGFSAGEYGVATWYSHDLHQWKSAN